MEVEIKNFNQKKRVEGQQLKFKPKKSWHLKPSELPGRDY